MGGPDAIRQLVNHKAWTDVGYKSFLGSLGSLPAPPPPPPGLPVGSPAPAFTLPDLNGTPITESSFNGSGTLLMFWNPTCGFCQRMLPQIKGWEQRKPAHAPRLVLVSGGTRDANRAMGLQSTVLLDDRFAVGQRYGSGGTPSGVLLDSKGQIASALAVGEPNVLRLLSGGASDHPSGWPA
jgi:thiol-disulfide isomerase/thioredoxin